MHKLLKNCGTKKIIVVLTLTLLTFFSANVVFSEMRITTHDGKIINVPVNSKDIKIIEFTQEEAGISIEGVWDSSIGFKYNITQSGNNFIWTVAAPISEQGKGTLSDKSIKASWSGTNGSGSASGRITSIDSSNRAKRIEWGNGVVFYR